MSQITKKAACGPTPEGNLIKRRAFAPESDQSERRAFAVLNQNRDFRRAYARGKSFAHPALVTYVVKNRAGFCRMGITASVKIGNAVQRNRARRIIKEAFRQLYPRVPERPGYDLVFVARTRTLSVKSTDILKVMKGQLKSAGIIPKSDIK